MMGNLEHALAEFMPGEGETECGALHKRERSYGIRISNDLFDELFLLRLHAEHYTALMSPFREKVSLAPP